MKLFISADIEGITGVTRWEETEFGGKGYEAACRQMSLEAAAACEAVLEAGHTVVVRDGHNDACNIDGNLLPDGAQLIRGWMNTPASMMAGLDESFDGAMYIGYHSPGAANTSPLAHTMSFSRYNYIKINGRRASEFLLNSLWADTLGVPSIFLAGDEGICQLSSEEYPGLITTAVKSGVGGGTCNLHPQESIRRIKTAAAEALSKVHTVRPLAEEYTLEICYKTHMAARTASWYPGAEQIDEQTVIYRGRNYKDVRIALSFMG